MGCWRLVCCLGRTISTTLVRCTRRLTSFCTHAPLSFPSRPVPCRAIPYRAVPYRPSVFCLAHVPAFALIVFRRPSFFSFSFLYWSAGWWGGFENAPNWTAAIIDSLGARTIMHNVYTFILMTLVLLFIAPLLEVRLEALSPCSRLLFLSLVVPLFVSLFILSRSTCCRLTAELYMREESRWPCLVRALV